MGCRESKQATTGDLSQTSSANDQIKSIVSKVKADVEAEYGKEFETFEAVSFRKQVVAENVYFVKVNLGGEYAHIKVSVPVPAPSEKAAAKNAPTEKKTEGKKEETSEEKGEGSEEKGEGSEDAKDGPEEEKSESTEEAPAAAVEDKNEEKPSARFLAVQKGRKANEDIVGFEVSEEAREEEEEEVAEEPKEEAKEEPKDEEPKEEPKEEEPKEEEPKEEEKPKEEEPKEEEAKEEEGGLLSTIKSEAAGVGIGF